MSGIVYDEILKTPVNLATAILLNSQDSAFIAGTITNEEGEFSFKNIKSGEKILQISYAGYSNISKKLYLKSDTQLDTIFIIPNMLGEVVIPEKIYKREIDKLLVSVVNLKLDSTANVLDLLNKLPGGYVNKIDNTFTIIGKEVRVLIDDKPMYIPFEQLAQILKAQNHSDIEKVEIMFTPPPKFKDEWEGAVINIIKKKDIDNRVWGSLSNDFRIKNKFWNQFYANINIQQNKLFFHFSISHQYRHQFETSEIRQRNYELDLLSNIQNDTSDNIQNNIYVSSNIDYKINLKNSIGIYYSLYLIHNNDINNYYLQRNNNLTSDTSIYSKNTEKYQNWSHSIHLFYKYKLKDKNFITFSAVSKFVTYKQNDLKYNSFFGSNDLITPVFNQDLKNLIHVQGNTLSIKADHEISFSKFRIYDGISANRSVRSQNVICQMLDTNNMWINDINQTNNFYFNENSINAYFSFGHQILEDFSYRLMAKAYHFFNYHESKTLNTKYPQSFFKIVPGVYFNYTLKDIHSFDLVYDINLYTPNILYLNPFKIFETTEYYIEGNPNLKSMHDHKLEFNYFNIKNNIAINLEYRRSDNMITLKPVVDSTKTHVIGYKYDNFGLSQQFQMKIPYNISFFDDIFDFNSNAYLAYQTISNTDNTYKNDNWNYGASINIGYNIKKIGLSFYVIESYNSASLLGYSKLKGAFCTSFGIDYTINEKWELGFQTFDLFKQDSGSSVFVYDGVEYKTNNIADKRYFRFDICYYFDRK
jgi:hypothetical protein